MKEYPSFVFTLRGRLTPDGAEHVLAAIETALPTVRLMFECPDPPKYEFREIGDRTAWLRQQMEHNKDWSLFSERGRGTTAAVGEDHVDRPVPLLSVALNAWPSTECADDLIMACGDAAHALHCEASALIDSAVLENAATQAARGGYSTDYVAELLANYPRLKTLPRRRTLPLSPDDWVAVDQIRWMNYWSDETAARMKVDERAFASLPAARYQKTAQGSYFRLTDEPLDVRRPEHQQALIAAYEHLPTVGVRTD